MTIAALISTCRSQKEDWRYTDLSGLAGLDFLSAAAPDLSVALPAPAAPHRLVFVNGRYCADLSTVGSLPSGLCFQTTNNVCELTVAAQCCLAVDPVELLFARTAAPAPTETKTSLRLCLGENARLTLLERHLPGPGGKLFAQEIEMTVVLAAQAKLVHAKTLHGDEASVHFSRTKVDVEEGAFYDHFSLMLDGKITRCESDVCLNGEMAETRLQGASLLRGASLGDVFVRVTHAAPHGTSRQVFKTVLEDTARGVFQGKTLVKREAQKTDGHQLSRALLLSDKAEMNAKPELEIYADDVKCSHGSAIGDLSEQELFYLRSRGLPEAEARAMLVQAFVQDLVDQIQAAEIARLVQDEVTAWLSKA